MNIFNECLLSEAEKKQIASAVESAEAKTSGEIVVCYVGQSGRYRWVYATAALLGLFVGTLLSLVVHWGSWSFSAWNLLLWQSISAFAFVLLFQFPALRRLLISKAEFATRTHTSAVQVFMESGVMRTRDRTGVLLYVSVFEHRVEIIADQGIHQVVGNGYWDQQVAAIILGIRANKAGEAICAAIAEIGSKLAGNFPPRADDTNELPNQPI
jgi:putative membrane protein